MDDLVERLRAFAAGCRGSMWQSRDETIALCDEAADEITALRARLAEVEKQRDEALGWRTVAESNQAMAQSWQARAERAEARVAELEAKLAKVIAAYRIEAMRWDGYSHDAFDRHIAELTGGEKNGD